MKSLASFLPASVTGKTKLTKDKNIPHLSDDESEELNDRLAERHEQHVKKHGLHFDRGVLKSYSNVQSDPELEHVNGSAHLNINLIEGKPLTQSQQTMHDAIKRNAHKAGENIHLYSGTHFNPKAAAKHSKDGILHLPAHISATHNLSVATRFAHKQRDGNRHIMKIDVEPHHKLLHLSHISDFKENESVIPSGTKVKYSHTTDHFHNGKKMSVHHFSIHSQE